MATASTTYALDQISQYLWTAANAQSNAFSNGANSMNNGRDIVLLVEGAALNYGIEQDLDGLQGVTNDVYRLCGAKLQAANEIISTGSGGIVPTPSGGNTSTIYYPINATLVSGDITGMTITNVDWKNLLSVSPTMTLNDSQFTYTVDYSYNIINGSFTFFNYTPQVSDTVGTFGFKAVT